MTDENRDAPAALLGVTLEWLLEDENPSVRWRTFTEILGRDDSSPEVAAARQAIADSPAVQALLAKMHPEGYWLQKNPRTKSTVGDGVEYGSFGTTHFCLSYLAELGMDRSHPQIETAAERYLSLQQRDGDWWLHLSCLLGTNIRTFVKLGYGEDKRVLRSLDLLLGTDREDGGYLCDLHEGKYKTRAVKSCVRGSVKVLLALAELPATWGHPRCTQLVGYFLRRGGVYRSKRPDLFVNDDMSRLAFPIIWRTNLWEILYALGRMGYGSDDRLSGAWAELDARADASGRYLLDWTPGQCPWKVGSVGEPNKWITFYVEAAKRHRDQGNHSGRTLST